MSIVNDEEKCTGCRICEEVCPSDAIIIVQGKAKLNMDECIECLVCIEECLEDALYINN